MSLRTFPGLFMLIRLVLSSQPHFSQPTAQTHRDGPAVQAGLQPGDVIVQIGDKAVDDVPSLGNALLSKNPGERVSVQVYQGNQHLTVNVTLEEFPAR